MQVINDMTENGGVIETWIDITRMKEREAELLEAEALRTMGASRPNTPTAQNPNFSPV